MCFIILLAAWCPLESFCAEDQPVQKVEPEKSKKKPRPEPSRPKMKPPVKEDGEVELQIYDISDLQDASIAKKIREEMPREWGDGRSLIVSQGKLVVMQTKENQKVIVKRLKNLRYAKD